MRKYLVIIEKAGKNYSAYVPDLPGCIATGNTPKKTERHMREAIEMHIHGLEEDGLHVPEPGTMVKYCTV